MPVSLSGSILITGSMTTSGTITAQTLVVQTITSSIVNMTGSNIFGSQLGDRQTFTGSMFVTGSGTFTSTISAIGESTLFRGVFNDPVPNTAAVLKMSSTPTPSALSTVVGARMTGNATANFDSYAGYFSNLTVSSGTGLSYGIFATASFHTFIGETRLAQGVFNDPIAGTAASVKISATPVSGYPTAVFTAGATGAASSNQNTYAGYFTNTTTVSGTGVNYGIYATGSNHFFGGNVGIGNTTPYSILSLPSGTGWNGGLSWNFTAAGAASRKWWINTDQIEYGDFRICTEKTQGGGAINSAVTLNERFYINAAGNAGIGTTDIVSTNLTGSLTIRKSYNGDTPNGATTQAYYSNQSALYLFGRNSGLSIISNNNEEGKIAFGNNSAAIYASITTGTAATSVGGDMYFKVGSDTERMRITTAGYLGIGTTSPVNKVDISGAGSSNTVGSLAVRGSGCGTFIINRLVSRETANQTLTIATVSSPGGNDRVFFKIQVINVSAVANYGNAHVGYALWDATTKSVTTMTLDTGNSNISNTNVGTLSWSGNNLQYATNGAGNYEMNHIIIYAVARDSATVI